MNKMQQKLQCSDIAAWAQGQKERGIYAWITAADHFQVPVQDVALNSSTKAICRTFWRHWGEVLSGG
jgi:hypothetical protein